ncbi:hypothetical protein RPMA_06320 [Tardiphaga alba]|uniref:Uncharacterized protein n=1 Tax=Tardiphaga alba TaxID=340268 RepID=A0ABX8A495_9BRAD|nr:hypothetical protein RPMA_06320 [Tardiphaga alba]
MIGSDRIRTEALDSCFDAFSSREPESTSLENALEHDPEKWIPVFGKDHALTNKDMSFPVTRQKLKPTPPAARWCEVPPLFTVQGLVAAWVR